ncbi:hypothetical protein ACHAXS_001088 [Conticribra weissflogii]
MTTLSQPYFSLVKNPISHLKKYFLSQSSSSPSPPHPFPPPNTKCRCPIYLFNPFSYHQYHEAIYQIRQHTYEGLGGRKFVRILPGSTLEALYPKRKEFKPDECMVCGFRWRDHLEYWWWVKRRRRFQREVKSMNENNKKKKNRGPSSFEKFEQYLENDAISIQRKSKSLGEKEEGESFNQIQTLGDTIQSNFNSKFAFYRNYVDEIPSSFSTKRKKELLRRKENKGKEIHSSYNIKYLVPRVQFFLPENSNQKQPRRRQQHLDERNRGNAARRSKGQIQGGEKLLRQHSFGSALLLVFSRIAALDHVDNLIWLCRKECIRYGVEKYFQFVLR